MSSPDSESPISEIICHTLPIPKLIKHLRHTFLVRDFNEVQNILMDRERSMKTEIENLRRTRDSSKDKIRSPESAANLSELERSNFEKKLRQNHRKIEELEETVKKLLEENLKMVDEKNKSIFELNAKINELETKNMENERLIGVYKDNCKCLDTKISKMGQEIEDLRHERLGATRTVEELRRKLLEVEMFAEGLKRKNDEANRTVEELRSEKLESDKANEYNKIQVEKLAPRVVKIEEVLADMLNVKVGDLASLVGELADLEGGSLNFQNLKGKKEISGNGSTVGDAEDMAIVSPEVRSTSKFAGSKSIGLWSEGEDVARTLKSSPRVENNECKEPFSPDGHGSGIRLISGEGRSSKVAFSSSINIIDILDSDEETNPPGRAHFSNREVGGPDAAENETKFEKNFVRSPFSSSVSKRNRTTRREDDLLANSVAKRARKAFADSEIFNDSNDDDSTDSDDESCSDAAINDLVASLRSNESRTKFSYKADMSRALQENDELCMNAVCALYRQRFFAGKSTQYRNSSGSEGFNPIDKTSGRTLAEYLIDGDKELRLRKSVAEVKEQRPDVISQCRKLANIYIDKLFEIYCSGKDPLFG